MTDGKIVTTVLIINDITSTVAGLCEIIDQFFLIQTQVVPTGDLISKYRKVCKTVGLHLKFARLTAIGLLLGEEGHGANQQPNQHSELFHEKILMLMSKVTYSDRNKLVVDPTSD